MPFRVNCPGCKTAYSVPEESLGKKLSCKKCGQVFAVGTAKPPAAPPPAPKPLPRREPLTPVAAAPKPSAQPQKSSRLLVLALAAALLVLGGAVAGGVSAFLYFRKPAQETPVARTTPPSTETNETITPPTEKGQQTEEKKIPVPEPSDNSSQPTPTIPVNLPADTATPASADKPDPPVADRAELPRAAEVGKPFKYQLSHPTEKVRMYTLHSGPKGLKMSKEGLIQWTPEAAQIGSHKMIVGVVTAKMSGANIYTVVVADPNAPTVKGLPADLDRVPRDAIAFCSLRVADTLKRPIAAALRKQLQDDPTLSQFKLLLGLAVEDVERAVVVFLALKPEVEGVALVTTIKPYERERLLFVLAPEKKEMKAGTATYYVGAKSPVGVYFLNERTFIVGLGKDVKKFLELPIGKDKPGLLSDALALAADTHTLVFGARPKLLIPIEKQDVPAPFQGYLPLLDAKSATLRLDADRDLRMDLRFAFADEEQAKKGEAATREALSMASMITRQFPATLAKIPIPEFKPLLPKVSALIEAMATALADKPPQRKNLVVEHAMRIQSPDWFATVVQAAPFLAPRPVKPTTPAADPKMAKDAEAAIKKLGGTVKHENSDDNKPIVGVEFRLVKLTDDDLAPLSRLPSLRTLDLQYSEKITDKGVKHLTGLVNLESLTMRKNLLTDDALADIKKLPKLTSLKLADNRITDKGLIHLKEMTQLQALDLSGNSEISDAGLEHLKGLTHLSGLHLFGTKVSDKGVAELKKTLTNTTVFK
jgi:predicted Zn finger-like uncharacterized protein